PEDATGDVGLDLTSRLAHQDGPSRDELLHGPADVYRGGDPRQRPVGPALQEGIERLEAVYPETRGPHLGGPVAPGYHPGEESRILLLIDEDLNLAVGK